uniref:arginine--tRNA ligase n=1 Tax=Glycine max TaxID=3847 RepID=A0A0R0HRN5_SOYBN
MLGLGCLNLNRFSHFPSTPSLPSSRSDLLKVASHRFALSATKTQQSSVTKPQSTSTAIIEIDNPASVKRQLAQLFDLSLRETVPDEPHVVPLVDACAVKGGAKFGDYQCNNAMGIWSRMKGKQTGFRGPPAIGQAIINNLPPSEMIDSCSVAGPGFVNVVLSKKWIAENFSPAPPRNATMSDPPVNTVPSSGDTGSTPIRQCATACSFVSECYIFALDL